MLSIRAHLPINEHYYLRLPIVCERDAQAMMECYHDPKVSPFIPDECMPFSFEMCLQRLMIMQQAIRQQSELHWFIALKENDLPIGKVSFHDWNHFHKRITISYQLQSPYWKQGITSAALMILIKAIFLNTDIGRIEAQTLIHNEPSIKVLKRVGFAFEGILRKYRMYKGELTDIVFFSYIRDQHLRAEQLL
jgi:RimJ/RimL family protein N-acetyltransferase